MDEIGTEPEKKPESEPKPRFNMENLSRWGLPALAGLLLIVLFVMILRHGSDSGDKTAPGDKPAAHSAAPQVDKSKPGGRTAQAAAAAIERQNTGTIRSYYGDQVKVVVIEGDNKTSGDLSADQAALLLKKLKGAKGPWNWDIDDATLASWIAGPYGDFFFRQDNTYTIVTGISSNGYVVSILINGQGQIVDYLIVSNADVLLPSTNENSKPPATDIKPDQPPAAE